MRVLRWPGPSPSTILTLNVARGLDWVHCTEEKCSVVHRLTASQITLPRTHACHIRELHLCPICAQPSGAECNSLLECTALAICLHACRQQRCARDQRPSRHAHKQAEEIHSFAAATAIDGAVSFVWPGTKCRPAISGCAWPPTAQVFVISPRHTSRHRSAKH